MRLFLQVLAATLVLLGVCSCTQLDQAVLTEEVTGQVTETTVISPGRTNVYYSTNYFTNYVVSPAAQGVADATGAIPVWGGLVSTVLTGVFGIYAASRNKRRGHALAEALVLANEAGRQILRSMPDGERIDENFKRAMVEEQVALGQANEITSVVRKVTRPHKKRVAS